MPASRSLPPPTAMPDKKTNPLEADIEGPVVRYARKHGMYAKKFTSPANRSVPDYLFLNTAGFVFFIEFKRPGGEPTPKQADEHKKIRENEGHCYIVDRVSVGKELVRYYRHVVSPKVLAIKSLKSGYKETY